MERLLAISNQLENPQQLQLQQQQTAASKKSPDDVVIVSAVRTPIARANKGSFKDTVPEDLLAAVLEGVCQKVNLDRKLVDDIQVGNVLPQGGGAAQARMASFYAGFPVETSVMTVNRQCSSGLQAVANVVGAVKSGFVQIGIGAGVESMTKGWGKPTEYEFSDKLGEVDLAMDCTTPMGITSENVAEKFGVTRDKQDQLAAASHAKAARAQKLGLYTEIIPVKVNVVNQDGESKEVLVTQDEGIREDTTPATLGKLKPSFKKGGTTTAGNSSQVSDGAAAVLIMKRSTAESLKLPILGRFLSYAVKGVPPSLMGIGPAYAIPEALTQAGLTTKDIDVYEINEAFASQAVYCCEKLGLDMSKVNPLGGAIALGHPLGCTGARQIATILPELKRRKAKYGAVSMCIGTGMGACGIIESEQN